MIASSLKSVFHAMEYLRLQHLLKQNRELYNRHSGEKAFLFATGTSLVNMDLSLFSDNLTIGCNQIYKHPSFSGLKLKYYIEGVPYRRWRENSPRFTHKDHHQLFSEINDVFSGLDTVHLYHATLSGYLKKRGYLKDVSKYYFLRSEPLEEAASQAVDLTRPITFADGGLTLMIALAIFMGCKTIYLFGCGYTYSPAQMFHFYNCLRYSRDLTVKEIDEMTIIFDAMHPESDLAFLDRNNIKLNDREILADFSLDHTKHPETDFYRVHRKIKIFAESLGVRIINLIPKGYSSPVYNSIEISENLKSMLW